MTESEEAVAAAAEGPEPGGALLFAAIGALEVLIGILLATVAAGSLAIGLGLVSVPGGHSAPHALLVANGVAGAGQAVILMVVGAGVIVARRWAVALTLVLAWLWIAAGAARVLGMCLVYGALSAPAAGGAAVAGGSAGLLALFHHLVPAILLGVVTPMVFVFFFSSHPATEIARRRPPGATWTDDAPLPVLVYCCCLAISGFFWLGLLVAGKVVLFGALLDGFAGEAVASLLALGAAVLATFCYGLRRPAWGVSLAYWGFLISSVCVTVLAWDARTGLDAMVSVGLGDSLLAVAYAVGRPGLPFAVTALWVVPVSVFAVWVGRFFVVRAAPRSENPQ
ncbi:MAG: hypothetical protein HYV63_25285 [Candidatus Schekmanbacteria bacterium]|nr:hypothetical protein [Candidatus Schekmanbacteria bacterium]